MRNNSEVVPWALEIFVTSLELIISRIYRQEKEKDVDKKYTIQKAVLGYTLPHYLFGEKKLQRILSQSKNKRDSSTP